MSKAHKVAIVLALIVLVALGVGLIRGWSPLAVAAGQAQSLESDTLFFVSGPQPSIQRVSASEPKRLTEQAVSVATEDIQIDTMMCDIAGLHSSPNGYWMAVEVGCEASVHTLVMEVATGEVHSVGESFFLSWAPDGDSFLVCAGHLGESAVLLVDAKNGRSQQVDTPPFTYDAAFSPDGKRIVYAITQGLGFGSEVWTMDRNGRNKEQIVYAPAHIIAFPRWSPTGDSIAFIRMADSNIPFTVGELVLTDGEGRNEQVIAPADAGHGYPPVWSPDGKQVAFVIRENVEDSAADIATSYLESNIYLVDSASGSVQAVTRFEGALTEAPAWSPDGAWLVFSTDAGGVADVWLVEVASSELQQITRDANARHPVWVAGGK